MPISNVLFVCEDNGFSSVIAEAYAARAGRGLMRAYSAGVAPAREFHPAVLEFLRAKGLRPNHYTPRSLAAFALAGSPRIDLVIALGAVRARYVTLPGEPPVRAWTDAPTGLDPREMFHWVRARADSLLLAAPVRRRWFA
jgi:protein-tyrosine-phosphatase